MMYLRPSMRLEAVQRLIQRVEDIGLAEARECCSESDGLLELALVLGEVG